MNPPNVPTCQYFLYSLGFLCGQDVKGWTQCKWLWQYWENVTMLSSSSHPTCFSELLVILSVWSLHFDASLLPCFVTLGTYLYLLDNTCTSLQAVPLLVGCPACLRNFLNFFCEMSCSPNQSSFISVTSTKKVRHLQPFLNKIIVTGGL